MRRGAVLVLLAAFCLTTAVLLRFYAYPQISRIPEGLNVDEVLVAHNAHWFDLPTLKQTSGTIKTTEKVTVDTARSKSVSKQLKKDVFVTNIARYSVSPGARDAQGHIPPPIFGYTQTVALDAMSGNVVAWDGNLFNGHKQTMHGQVIKFPADTKKTGHYSYYDPTLQREIPLNYVGEKTIDGVKGYAFSHTITNAKVRTLDVPAELFGKGKGAVSATQMYTNTRTLYVHPETGVILTATEDERDRYEAAGKQPVQVMNAQSAMDDKTVKYNTGLVRERVTKLAWLGVWGPLLLGVTGAVLLIAAFLLEVLPSVREASRRRS